MPCVHMHALMHQTPTRECSCTGLLVRVRHTDCATRSKPCARNQSKGRTVLLSLPLADGCYSPAAALLADSHSNWAIPPRWMPTVVERLDARMTCVVFSVWAGFILQNRSRSRRTACLAIRAQGRVRGTYSGTSCTSVVMSWSGVYALCRNAFLPFFSFVFAFVARHVYSHARHAPAPSHPDWCPLHCHTVPPLTHSGLCRPCRRLRLLLMRWLSNRRTTLFRRHRNTPRRRHSRRKAHPTHRPPHHNHNHRLRPNPSLSRLLQLFLQHPSNLRLQLCPLCTSPSRPGPMPPPPHPTSPSLQCSTPLHLRLC